MAVYAGAAKIIEGGTPVIAGEIPFASRLCQGVGTVVYISVHLQSIIIFGLINIRSTNYSHFLIS